ncbi:hypothetical protein Pan216_10530 [Planctomycetes bacterium Pan216]|uniref:DUF3311 domain-containing protein n=1 Tax=Kolteria novifilia TaxID=2527975 RepID=A0A518AZS1_9BACT|nr:hypothetical protein Pan216_10530 [Planctomycetes bacterium Pan216]
MSRGATTLISFIALVLTVPWLYTSDRMAIWFGFPPWAFYTIATTVVYAVVLNLLLGTQWSRMAGGDDADNA